MSLKLIPLEERGQNGNGNQNGSAPAKKQKHFNPGGKIKKNGKDFSLKNICLRLVHFINKGSNFTYQQIDELIVNLHKSILSLQKKKQDILKKQYKNRKK